MNRAKSVFNWSGGKDSALALHRVLNSKVTVVSHLLTSFNVEFNRVSMHGVRAELIEMQAESIGIPLVKMSTPEMPDMEQYERCMFRALERLKHKGIAVSIFGDIFLEDLRRYREKQLARINIEPPFPIWRIPTVELMKEFIGLGFRAVTVCVNERYLTKEFVGREIDEDFVRDLPSKVDSCGENGEYHSFVYDGPIFSRPIPFVKGEIVYRRYLGASKPHGPPKLNITDEIKHRALVGDPFEYGFWFCDLINTSSNRTRGLPK